jgi:mannose-6-phosphate isomerase
VNPTAGPVEPIAGGTRQRLARCPYFALERLRLDGPASVGSPERFTILIGLEGAALVRHGEDVMPLVLGQTLLLPAALGPCEIMPDPQGTGEAIVLTCIVP